MTDQDKAYAELLLAWARTIDKHGLSLDAFTERYGPRVVFHQTERTKP